MKPGAVLIPHSRSIGRKVSETCDTDEASLTLLDRMLTPLPSIDCDFGNLCAFAHSDEELSIDILHKMEHDDDFYMFHFKTVWCPFNTESREHYREKCVYAHNW